MPARAQVLKRFGHVNAAATRACFHYLNAVLPQRLYLFSRSVPGDKDEGGRLAHRITRRFNEFAIDGELRPGVENHPQWLSARAFKAAGQQRVVGARRAYSYGNSVDLAAQRLHQLAACL